MYVCGIVCVVFYCGGGPSQRIYIICKLSTQMHVAAAAANIEMYYGSTQRACIVCWYREYRDVVLGLTYLLWFNTTGVYVCDELSIV